MQKLDRHVKEMVGDRPHIPLLVLLMRMSRQGDCFTSRRLFWWKWFVLSEFILVAPFWGAGELQLLTWVTVRRSLECARVALLCPG